MKKHVGKVIGGGSIGLESLEKLPQRIIDVLDSEKSSHELLPRLASALEVRIKEKRELIELLRSGILKDDAGRLSSQES